MRWRWGRSPGGRSRCMYHLNERKHTSEVPHSVIASHTLSYVRSAWDTHNVTGMFGQLSNSTDTPGVWLDYQGKFDWHKRVGLHEIWLNEVPFIEGVLYLYLLGSGKAKLPCK